MGIIRKDKRFPLARPQGLLTERVDSEIVIFDEETKHAHCLAPLAAVVFSHCDGETSPRELARIASAQLDQPVADQDVEEAIAQLHERGLLRASPSIRISRRDMIQRGAAASAAASAAALIFTIDPSIAQAAGRCVSSGCSNQGNCVSMGTAGCTGGTSCKTCGAKNLCLCG